MVYLHWYTHKQNLFYSLALHMQNFFFQTQYALNYLMKFEIRKVILMKLVINGFKEKLLTLMDACGVVVIPT